MLARLEVRRHRRLSFRYLRKGLLMGLIFLLIAAWMNQYPPSFFKNLGGLRIWPLGELGVNPDSINPDGFNYGAGTIRIPSENSGNDLPTILLLTAVFAFAILKIVNPPRAYFGRCGVFIFGKNIGKIAL